jgi:hypothetical protein
LTRPRLAGFDPSTEVGIERLDEDGVIRIAGVSYETAQAIEKASGGKPVGSTPG